MEEWRPVVGFEGRYEISSLGRVRSRKGRIMSLQNGWKGYVHIRLDGKCFRVHRLVAEAFIGRRPVGQVVAHNNGDPTDNAVSNLRYATPASNSSDMKKHGTSCVGEARWNAKLTEQDIEHAKFMRSSGSTQQEIANALGVTQPHVSKILNKRMWAHVS